jgi:hypothetical protein
MARPVGSGVVDLPSCPVEGHEGGRVTLNGRYGTGTRRQRYRCYPANGSAPHNFADVLARIVAHDEECGSCENTVPAHKGPRVARRYEFPVREAATALVLVGQGLSYTEASARARRRGGRPQVNVSGAQLVENWVEVLGPVATAPYAEVAWPETIAVDSTKFMIKNPVTIRPSVGFSALAVWGYPAGESKGRLWAIRAVPEAKTADWTARFESLPGTPTLMICDLAQAPISAARLTWGPSGPHVKYCEWHLRRCAAELLRPYGISHLESSEMRLLAEAFRSSKGWQAFKELTTSYPNVEEWAHSVMTHGYRARSPAGVLYRRITASGQWTRRSAGFGHSWNHGSSATETPSARTECSSSCPRTSTTPTMPTLMRSRSGPTSTPVVHSPLKAPSETQLGHGLSGDPDAFFSPQSHGRAMVSRCLSARHHCLSEPASRLPRA